MGRTLTAALLDATDRAFRRKRRREVRYPGAGAATGTGGAVRGRRR